MLTSSAISKVLKHLNATIERTIFFLLCLLIISGCSLLPFNNSTSLNNDKNSSKGIVTIDQNPAKSQEAIISTDELIPYEEAYKSVGSVKQIRDVKESDWAYLSLKNITERYGIVQIYKDFTFRGNRAATRYEVVGYLGSVLDVASREIGKATANVVSKSDLEKLLKSNEDLAQELAILRGRIDSYETIKRSKRE
jgi:hypothetical protein